MIKLASIDEMDTKILREYMDDSRRSYREIARRLGVSPGTIMTRAQRMEDKGIITKYSVQVNSEKLGYDLTALIECTVSEGMMLEAGHEITKLRQVCAAYNVTGDSDVVVLAKFKNRAELSAFTKNLLKMPNIVRTKTHLALFTLKEDFNII